MEKKLHPCKTVGCNYSSMHILPPLGVGGCLCMSEYIHIKLFNVITYPCHNLSYRKTSKDGPNPYTYMFLVSSYRCLCLIHWSHVLNGEWRCCWSSADRRCSNYIWVIDDLIHNTSEVEGHYSASLVIAYDSIRLGQGNCMALSNAVRSEPLFTKR